VSLIGTSVAGKYRVDSLIGSGSTGDVYLCRHIQLDKIVALKVLHADMVTHANFVERFKREARAASRLEHPNSVRVLDFGEDGGVLYIAMEYIAGRDLWSVLDEEWPLDNARIVDIMCQVLGALGTAHNLGIVHRDLKPENIMVRRAQSDSEDGDKDHVTVCDFGIAQLSPIQLTGAYTPLTPVVTGDGMVVGTPAYMSPEQARAEPLDARSDIYSAGVVLFQMLTRQLPFTAETPIAVAVMHCSTPPPAPSQLALVHPRLESVCLRALSKVKETRFQTAREMQVALQAVLTASTMVQAKPRRLRKPYLPLPAPISKAPRLPRAPSSLAPVERDRTTEPPSPPRTGDPRKRTRMAVAFGVVLLGVLSLSQLIDTREPVAEMAAQPNVNVPGDTLPAAGQPSGIDSPVAVPRLTLEPTTLTSSPKPEGMAARLAAPELARPAARAPSQRPSDSAPGHAPGAKPSLKPVVATQPRARAAADSDGRSDKPATAAPSTSASARAATQPAAGPISDELGLLEHTSEPARMADKPTTSGSTPSMSPSDFLEAAPASSMTSAPTRSVPAPSPAPRAAELRPLSVPADTVHRTFDDATVVLGAVATQSAVSKASIRNALNQSALTRCYRDSLRLGAASPASTAAELELTTNMGGRIDSAALRSANLPKSLQACIEQVAKAGRVREVDTGVARATVTLQFQP
jgi:serine/threonine-protein kinase